MIAWRENVDDGDVRQVLAQIAEDERRHAELGWRFVKWVLDNQPASFATELERRIEPALEQHLATVSQASPAPAAEPRLLAHGLLGLEQRREAARAALLEICLPCTRALFANRLQHAA